MTCQHSPYAKCRAVTDMANGEFQGSGGNLSSLPVQCFAETSAIDGATRSMGYLGQAVGIAEIVETWSGDLSGASILDPCAAVST